MYVCHKKVTPSWIVDDDDIYIMVECMYVSCHEKVTPSWIVDDDDIYIYGQIDRLLLLPATSLTAERRERDHHKLN